MNDVHSIWSHRWITPKARCKKSKIKGLGVVAIKPIKKREIVGILGGVIVPKSSLYAYRKKIGDVGIQINDDFFICPTDRDELKRTGVFNHSCNPNIGYLDSITLVAMRNIRSGEEVVFDYAFSETEDQVFACRCGAKVCRKFIRATDWKSPELQKRYGKYFSPYLKRKIKPLS